MSADNGVYILHTCDNYKLEDDMWVRAKCDAYRVAHIQGIDQFYWYEDNEIYNLGWYMRLVWGNSPVFYSLEEAIAEANKIYDTVGYVEYGVGVIDATKYNFIT